MFSNVLIVSCEESGRDYYSFTKHIFDFHLLVEHKNSLVSPVRCVWISVQLQKNLLSIWSI